MSELKKLNKDFAYELMAVPTYSGMEHRMVAFILLFAEKNKISYQFDNYGNIYLTKGELAEGEYYPCMTAHIDSVQTKHKEFINGGDALNVITRDCKNGKTEIYGEDYGLGGDDKCGVLIALSCFQFCDKLKASFFLEEETGCKGSSNLDKDFFSNVGYVIGFDSPDFNRSAWSVSGAQMFTKDFYLNYMKEICDKHGRTKFYSEPFTDIKEIRNKVPIQCMNFGSGYYNAHMSNEYVVLEEVDDCIELALNLIDKLKYVRYELESGLSTYGGYPSYTRNPKTGIFEMSKEESSNKDDIAFLKTLGDNDTRYYNNYRSRYFQDWEDEDEYFDYYYGKYNKNAHNKEKEEEKNESIINDERIIAYVMERYDERIEQIEKDVRAKCTELNIDFDTEFGDIFAETVTF